MSEQPPNEDPGFHPGSFPARPPRVLRLNRIRRRPQPSAAPPPPEPPLPFFPCSWEDRTRVAPAPGHIRLLSDPSPDFHLARYWGIDRTLTEWVAELDRIAENNQTSQLHRVVFGEGFLEEVRTLFYENQRKRWLARWVLNKWRQRRWPIQCNVDLIDLAPVPDRHAIMLTDTTNRQIYRLHRNDVFRSLVANIAWSEEMFPDPRPPTNPYTNAPLTLAQTISVCQQLVVDYGRRGLCPPVLLAAFCASGYSVERLRKEHASLLSQHAIVDYFKDITLENRDTVTETIFQLLTEAGCDYSPIAVRRWMAGVVTPLHKEWLAFVRDYTLYMNLHVQVRPSWVDRRFIDRDVRALYDRTTLPDPASRRIQNLRQLLVPPPIAIPPMLFMPPPVLDASGGVAQLQTALELIQHALFRM